MSGKRKPQDLQEWLEIATCKLSVSVKQRIGEEIEGHYAEAVAAHEAAGLPESALKEKALADLGSPQFANRQFRNIYLLETEAVNLEMALSRKWKAIQLAMDTFVFAGLVWEQLSQILSHHGEVFFHSRLAYDWLIVFLEFLTLVFLPALSFGLAKKRNDIKRMTSILFIEPLSGLYPGLLISFSFPGYFPSARSYYFLVGSFVFYCALMSSMAFRLSRKLRHAG